jgi:hypothetical protein
MAAGVTVDLTGLTVMLERLRARLPDTISDAAYATAEPPPADQVDGAAPQSRLAGSVGGPVGNDVRVEVGAPYARSVAWPAVNRATRNADTVFAAKADTAIDRLAVTL